MPVARLATAARVMSLLTVGFGLCVGILVGMTGIGGGSIMTPLLILVLGVKPVVAIGTDLSYAAITKTLGGWRHMRAGNVDQRTSMWLATGSVPGAIAGVWVLKRLHAAVGDNFDHVVLIIVAAALALTGAATLARALFVRNLEERERETVVMTGRLKVAAVLIGLSVGFVLGISSAGSGALIAVGLIVVFRLSPRRVVGTDVFHAAILLWAASIAHLLSGNVDVGMTLNLLIGSLPGVWLGTSWSGKVPVGVLRPLLGIVLCTASVGLLSKSGVGVPAPLIGVVPLVLGLLTWSRKRGSPLARKVSRALATLAGRA